MNLLAKILLFLPLSFVVCLVSSTLRRDSTAAILRYTMRLFLWLTGSVFVICFVLYWVMEFILDH